MGLYKYETQQIRFHRVIAEVLIWQVVNLVAATTGSFLIDRVGRRPLFLISTAGMFIGNQFSNCFCIVADHKCDSILHVDSHKCSFLYSE